MGQTVRVGIVFLRCVAPKLVFQPVVFAEAGEGRRCGDKRKGWPMSLPFMRAS